MGRLKKHNAVKAGELKNGWKRFSFIAHKGVVSSLKRLAQREGKTIKGLMDELLSEQLSIKLGTKINREQFEKQPVVPKGKHQELMIAFLNQKGDDRQEDEVIKKPLTRGSKRLED